MYYINLVIIFITFAAVLLVARNRIIFDKKIEKNKRNFLEQESKANSTRKADISNLDYVNLSLDKLPVNASSSDKFNRLIDELKNLSKKRIINLSQYSNTELKLMYGPANLDALSEYDQNYLSLIRTLDSISSLLIEEGNISAAKDFLQYSISIGSDLSSSYRMLGKIYLDENDNRSFNELEKLASRNKTLSGPIIVNNLNNIKSAHK